jgi:hypothetical protein
MIHARTLGLLTMILIVSPIALSFQISSAQINQSVPIRIVGNVTTDSKNSEKDWLSDPLTLFSHPFILVLVGSTASGLLIAYFTRMWEKRQKAIESERQERQQRIQLNIAINQKELDLKIRLVEQISSSITKLIWPLLSERQKTLLSERQKTLSVIGSSHEPTAHMAEMFHEWELSSISISTQLLAFFPDTKIQTHWKGFIDMTKNFYALAIMGGPAGQRKDYRDKLKDNKLLSKRNIDWDGLVSDDRNHETPGLYKVGDAIVDNSKEFVDIILNTEIKILRKMTK